MTEPNWIPSPIAAELERVVGDLRASRRVAQHVTLQGQGDTWAWLVEEVEAGYTDSVDEYANDVSSRAILDTVLTMAPPNSREQLQRWLLPFDERFDQATVRASAPFYGRDAGSRWYARIPKKLVGELKDDLEARGVRPG